MHSAAVITPLCIMQKHYSVRLEERLRLQKTTSALPAIHNNHIEASAQARRMLDVTSHVGMSLPESPVAYVEEHDLYMGISAGCFRYFPMPGTIVFQTEPPV